MQEQVFELIKEKKFGQLRLALADMEPIDVAAILQEASERDLPVIFRLLPKELAADVFVEMESGEQELLITTLSDTELQEVTGQLFADDTVDIIEEMPANVVARILRSVSPDRRKIINELLKYPDNSAGSIMTTEYVDLHIDMSVSDAFQHIKKTGLNKETVYTCYVTDRARHLTGVVSALTLMLADTEASIGDIMDKNVIYAETLEKKEDVAHKIEKYDFLALPVVDGEKRLVGIVTVDDAIDVITEEAEDQFAMMAAVSPMEDDYLHTSVITHARKRIIWLLILMVSAKISGQIITHYQNIFASVPLLISFLPMLMDTGGNCGSQSSTMIIRGLATEELHMRDYFRALFKELRIGLMIGITLAVVNFGITVVLYHSVPLGIVSGITLICTVLMAKALGCSLPMLAKRLHLDPAIMASPLITTMVDCFTVFLYFKIAQAFLTF